jgi:CPA2 family monovalent cation:H+ antiporter-2
VHGEPLLTDVAIILLAAFPLLFVARHFRIPEVLCSIVAGIAIGPHALGLIRDTARIESIAELGVALILFFIGLHVPLGKLKAFGRTAFLSGPLQMGLTALGVAGAAMAAGNRPRLALFYGILAALGSTAVVLPILTARDELGTTFAQRFLGVSLFQDLAVIPLMLLVPIFAAGGSNAPAMSSVLLRVGLAIGGVVALVLVARAVVPRLFTAVARLGREAFTAAAVVLIVGTIAAAEGLGISSTLGAFMAGLIVGDTDFIHEIEGILRPFRDFLSALFFTSIGMLLDPGYVARHPLSLTLTVLAVVTIKVLAAYPAFRLSPSVRRTSVRAAFAIAPVGEFSFLLAQAGKSAGVIGEEGEQMFVAVAVVTLVATPLLVILGRWIAEHIHETGVDDVAAGKKAPERHVVVIGYGLNGQNVARVLGSLGIARVVIDEDPERIAKAREAGHHAVLADAGDTDALRLVGIPAALTAIVAISDPHATRRIVGFCRKLNPQVRIIVRTRYVSEVEQLRKLGANEVIPEEFETSLEIVTRVLRVMCVPQNIVASQLALLRDEGYRLLRDPAVRATDPRRLAAALAPGTAQTFVVLPDSFAEGRTIASLALGDDRVTVAALLRDGRALTPLPLDEPLQPGDTMLLVGAHEELTRAVGRLEGG